MESDFKERLAERIEEFLIDATTLGGEELAVLVPALTSEIYSFLSDRDEGEEMIFPVPKALEDDPEGEEQQ